MKREENRPAAELSAVVSAAAATYGHPLTDPVDLGGSRRTTVLRCQAPNGPVIVKAYQAERSFFAAEASGLVLCSAAPELLAVEVDYPLIVMSDLGTGPSLADRLLGTDAKAAEDALLAWARCYGEIAAEAHGRANELASLRAAYGEGNGRSFNGRLAATFRKLADVVQPWLGAAPAGISAELEAAVATIADDRFPVFSPGDICPDNNLLHPDGMRVFDLEGAAFHSVFLDAAYTRMPFATCWCVYRLPGELAARLEETYRAQVLALYPDLVDDQCWNTGLRAARVAWTADITVALLERATAADRPAHPTRAGVPTQRQLLRYRWETAAEELDAAAEFPALTWTLRELLAATSTWDVPAMPYYPAFRR